MSQQQPAELVAVPVQSNMAPDASKDMASFMVLLMTLALLSFNYYHAFTYWSAKLYNPTIDNYIFATIMPLLFSVIAFIEIPLTVLFYNALRLRDSILLRLFYLMLLVTVVIATTMMGSSSQNGLDEKRDNSVSSYQQKLINLDSQMHAAKSRRDATIALSQTKGETKKAMFIANAEAVYQRKLVNIGGQKVKIMETKPVHQTHGAGMFSMSDDTFNLFWAAFLSLMGIALTIYKIDYIQAVMRIPVVSLKNKLNHDWSTSKEDFQNQQHSVSPVKNILTAGFLARASSAGNITPKPAKNTTAPPPESAPKPTKKEDNKTPSPQVQHIGEEIFFYDDGYVFSEQSGNGKTTLRVYDKNRKNVIFETKSTQSKPTEIMIDHPEHAVSKQFFKAVKNHYGIDLNPVKASGTHPSPRLEKDTPKNDADGDRAGMDARVANTTKKDAQDAPRDAPEKIDMDAMRGRWVKAENEKTGGKIDCVFCGKETGKRTDTKRHCSAKCRKAFARLSDQQKSFLTKKEDAKSSKKMIKQGEVFKIGLSSPPKGKPNQKERKMNSTLGITLPTIKESNSHWGLTEYIKSIGIDTTVHESRSEQYRIFKIKNREPATVKKQFPAISMILGIDERELKWEQNYTKGVSAILAPLDKKDWKPVELDVNALEKGKLIGYVGKAVNGSSVTYDRNIEPHLLIAGDTNSGKTEAMRVDMASMRLSGLHPEIYIIDPKEDMEGERSEFYTSDISAAILKLEHLSKTADERKHKYNKAGCKNYFEYQTRIDANEKPLMVYIDEAADLLTEDLTEKKETDGHKQHDRAFAILYYISRKNRAGGLFLTFGIQHPKAKTLPTEIRNNLAIGCITASGRNLITYALAQLPTASAAGAGLILGFKRG